MWGILAGLGQGLTAAAKEPQQYYQNTRQAMLEDAQLETQALNRALAQIQGMQDVERHPLEMQGLQSVLDNQAMNRKATQAAMAGDIARAYEGRDVSIPEAVLGDMGSYSGLAGPDGRIALPPLKVSEIEANIQQSKDAGRAALTSAGASVTNANANALEARSRAKLYDAQTAAGGFRPAGSGSSAENRSRIMERVKDFPKVVAAREAMGFWPAGSTRHTAALAALDAAMGDAVRAQGTLEGMTPQEIEEVITALRIQNALGTGAAPGRSGAPAPGGTNF